MITKTLNCSQVNDRLIAYLHDGLPDTEQAAVDRHLTGCEACRREIRSAQRLETQLRAEAVHRQPEMSHQASNRARRNVYQLMKGEYLRQHAISTVKGFISIASIALLILIVSSVLKIPVQPGPTRTLPALSSTSPDQTDASATAETAMPASTPQGVVQSVNEIGIEMRSVYRWQDQTRQDYLRAEFCFTLPSDGDWQLGLLTGTDVVLETAGKKSILSSGGGLSDAVEGNKKGAYRCAYVLFPIIPDQDLSKFTITIRRLATSIPEVPDCQKAQEKLDRARTGIVIRCFNESTGSGGISGFDVLQRPGSTSEAQARELVMESFSDIVEGPWVFTAGLPEPSPQPPTPPFPRLLSGRGRYIAFDVVDAVGNMGTHVGLMPVDCLSRPQSCLASILILPEVFRIDMGGPLAWDPGGKRFALISNLDITIIALDGSGARNITRSPEREACPAWAPDGENILYTKEAELNGKALSELWLIRPDGTHPRFLIQGSCGTWAQDAQRIAYTVNIYFANQAGDPARASYVYILDIAAQGSNPVKLPTPLDYVEEAIFSPDGSKIAFSGPIKDRFGIFMMNADGSGITELTPMLPDAIHPVWSPDGRQIAFTAHNSHTDPGEVYVINLDYMDLINVSNAPEWDDRDPVWSPDGSKLLFTTNRNGSFDLYIVNRDGSGLEKITDGERNHTEYLCPSWQP